MREAALEVFFRIDELAGPFGLGSDEHQAAGNAARALNAEVERLLALLQRVVRQAPIDYDLMNNDPEWHELLGEVSGVLAEFLEEAS